MIWPEQAYVPGQTPRHPEGLFDAVRDTALPSATVEELAQCPAFRHGLMYQRAGFYWEAHEVLEPVWMACPEDSAARQMVQGLIQLANAHLKVRMMRPRAVVRLCDIALGHFAAARQLGGKRVMGIEISGMQRQVETLRET